MIRSLWTTGTALAVAVTLAACSSTAGTPTSPSAAASGDLAAAADGSTLKATAPTALAPINDVRLETRRPTMEWTASTGTFVAVSPVYEVEVSSGGAVVYTAIVEGTSHQVPADAEFDRQYSWRVRARLESAFGPWSAPGTFRTPQPAVAAAASLPFSIPASCGAIPNPPGNRAQCASDVARVSPEWGRCSGGSGVGCHRFARHLAAALAASDPRWGLISKNPGEQQCTWNRCGGLSGEGYGEDIVAFRHGPTDFNWEGFDVVSGAGAPGAGVNWARVPSRRQGNNWRPVPSPIDR